MITKHQKRFLLFCNEYGLATGHGKIVKNLVKSGYIEYVCETFKPVVRLTQKGVEFLNSENELGVLDLCENNGVSPHARKFNAISDIKEVLIDYSKWLQKNGYEPYSSEFVDAFLNTTNHGTLP